MSNSFSFVLEQRIVPGTDVVCIDPQSATERSVRVAQMKQIFSYTDTSQHEYIDSAQHRCLIIFASSSSKLLQLETLQSTFVSMPVK